MSEAYIGQIQPFAFNFAPKNWAMCNGQILSISQNAALFSLLGTQYGGNGTTTFALPNLQSRVPVHVGTLNGEPFTMGETGGEENVMLSLNNLPAHTHAFLGSTQNGNSSAPLDGVLLATPNAGGSPGNNFYTAGGMPQPLNSGSIAPVGGNTAHPNIQPYLALNWCICQYGIFPSRN